MFQNREVAFTIVKISINNKEIVNDMVHLLQHTPLKYVCHFRALRDCFTFGFNWRQMGVLVR